MKKITHTEIRMYRMGTGDCFALKFFADDKLMYKMLIDCGTWQGSGAGLKPYIEDLKAYVDNHVDLLVVTHEHKDHVYGFEAGKALLTQNFTVDRVWMGWTEEDGDATVKQWKKDHGEKKKALALAALRLKKIVATPGYEAQLKAEANGHRILAARKNFAEVLEAFTSLQLDLGVDKYVGLLAGMKVVKDSIGKNKTDYKKPGDIIDNIDQLPGIKFYVLGPPLSWDDARLEAGGKGESYDHNKELPLNDAFAAAILDEAGAGAAPFAGTYDLRTPAALPRRRYADPRNAWRKIDDEWLLSAGSLALRVNTITNNLSLALAIEFEDRSRVMLFPGDAEFGSWASWHKIKWAVPSKNPQKHLTEELLNRTVFYKVAHHLSHNGTAERLGLEMMEHPDLAAMATLDYAVICPGWKSTMPNRAILAELLKRTRGRLMVMQTKDLFFDQNGQVPLSGKILAARSKMTAKDKTAFSADYKENKLYLQYTVHA